MVWVTYYITDILRCDFWDVFCFLFKQHLTKWHVFNQVHTSTRSHVDKNTVALRLAILWDMDAKGGPEEIRDPQGFVFSAVTWSSTFVNVVVLTMKRLKFNIYTRPWENQEHTISSNSLNDICKGCHNFSNSWRLLYHLATIKLKKKNM